MTSVSTDLTTRKQTGGALVTDREIIEQAVKENGWDVLFGGRPTRRPIYARSGRLWLQAAYDNEDNLLGVSRIWSTELGDDPYDTVRYITDCP